MAELTDRVDTEVFVDHGSFDLIDDGGPQRARPDFAATAEWLFVGDNEIIVVSAAGRHHHAAVAVEAWDGEPPSAAGWEDFRTARLRLDSGLVEINPLVEGEDASDIEVGGPGVYRVRAHVTGRAALAALDPALPAEPRGVERYLFQFWPAVAEG
ncbi:MAG TPA: hypothetical protein VES42_07915 [Pilimelia sp.]|nr:hypothetical protein [Pilimelia sp.]